MVGLKTTKINDQEHGSSVLQGAENGQKTKTIFTYIEREIKNFCDNKMDVR
jgi:hypothetical protein